MNSGIRNIAGLVLTGMIGYACATAGVIDDPPVAGDSDAGEDASPAFDAGAGGCGALGERCCDAGCAADGSFCAADDYCRAAHPNDMGAPCTSGATCQSGLCTYVQGLDASPGAKAPSPSICSGPCWQLNDCLPGWTCWNRILTAVTAPGTCICAPAPETCDGKDDNCDGVIDEEPGASNACTTALGFPAKCVDGGCACTQLCDGGCATLTSDPMNCGACGKTCVSGLQVCANSECVCGGGGTLCPIPDGGLGDAGYLVPDGGPGGSPAACISTQSDPNNCGGCGILCPYTCAGGCVPAVLATLSASADAAFSGTPSPAVASTGSQVIIMTAASGGVIEECGVAGCNQNPVTIASGLNNTNNTGPSGLLALGGSWAYWPGQTAVSAVTITSPTASVFAQPAGASVYAVATNTTQVFWSDTNLGILSCKLGATCASPTTLVPNASPAASPQVLAADQTYVYWADANGDVFSAPVGGGSAVLVGSGVEGGSSNRMAMLAFGGRVYYVDATSGNLATASGGTASSGAIYFASSVNAVATDGTALYWSNGTNIFKCALGASCATPTPIYGGMNAIAIAVDGTNTYWIDDGANNNGVARVWEFHK